MCGVHAYNWIAPAIPVLPTATRYEGNLQVVGSLFLEYEAGLESTEPVLLHDLAALRSDNGEEREEVPDSDDDRRDR